MGDTPKDFRDPAMRARGGELIKQGYGYRRITEIMGTKVDQTRDFYDRYRAFGEDLAGNSSGRQIFTDAQRIDAVKMLAAGYSYVEVMAHSGARHRGVITGWKRRFPEIYQQVKDAPSTWVPPRHRKMPPLVSIPPAVDPAPATAAPVMISTRRSGNTVTMEQIDPADFDAADIKAMKERIADLEAEAA